MNPEKLPGAGLRERVLRLSHWRLRGERELSKTFLFDDFQSGLAFVNRVGKAAAGQGHYPESIRLAWGRADVKLHTPAAGGLTEADFLLAAAIDREYFRRG